jgi:hypothetical protein
MLRGFRQFLLVQKRTDKPAKDRREKSFADYKFNNDVLVQKYELILLFGLPLYGRGIELPVGRGEA